MPRSTSQITLAQRQSYYKSRPLNHISAAFYRPTPQLQRYETVCHTEASACVCERRRLSGRGRACVCVWVCVLRQTSSALELLAAASDSVSSSPFIRSASRHCHLSFPRTYITRAFAGPADHWLASVHEDVLVGWPALCSVSPGGERATGTAFPSQISLNMQTGWMSDIYRFIYSSCLAVARQDPVSAIYLGDLFTWKMS